MKNQSLYISVWQDGNQASYMSGGIATVHKDGDGKTIGREIEIGIENLCFRLCRTAEVYYKENKDKFKFNYTIVNGI